jgi:HK97 family phage portal protein
MLPVEVRDDIVPVTSSWQYTLLHQRPNAEQSPTEFYSQISGSIETNGNAYLQKIKNNAGRVVELIVLDPNSIFVRRNENTGMREFEFYLSNSQMRTLTTSDIIHIPGFAPAGSLVGMSPISQHRHVIANAMAMVEFTGRFFSNDASPGLVIKVPGQVGQQQARQMLETWRNSHSGLGNSHSPAILAAGAELEKIPINMQDAAFVEQTKMGVEDIARIYRVPAHMLGLGQPSGSTAEQESIRFLNYTLLPRIRRIEQGIGHDLDLFGGTSMRPFFVVDSILRADLAQRYTSYVAARQAGWLSANEIRELEGRPPVDNGDDVQQTPVGGAPNVTRVGE